MKGTDMPKSTGVSKRVDIKVLKVTKSALDVSKRSTAYKLALDFKIGQSHGPVRIIF